MTTRPLITLALAAALVTACKGDDGKDGGAGKATSPSPATKKAVPVDERPLAAADPRDDQFRAWALTLGRQIADAIAGKPPEPSLLGPDESRDLRTFQPDTTRAAVAKLPEVLAVVVTAIGVRKGGTETCMLSVIAWGDERLAWSGGGVHWSALSVDARANETGAGPALSAAAIDAEWPELRAVWDRTLEARAAGQRLPAAPKDLHLLLGERPGSPGDVFRRGEAFDLVDRALADPEPWAFDLVEVNVYVGQTRPRLEEMNLVARKLGAYARARGDDVYLELPTVSIVR